jgi:hypothetical protein
MVESSVHRAISSLEVAVASELSVLLENHSSGLKLEIEPASSFLSGLELYIPQLLTLTYPKWQSESLDGFYLTRAQRIATDTAELAGLCILISDQTVTPFFARLVVSQSRDRISAYQIRLGEPGGGRLGISGPSCASWKAQKLLDNLNARLENIRWSYAISSEYDNK